MAKSKHSPKSKLLLKTIHCLPRFTMTYGCDYLGYLKSQASSNLGVCLHFSRILNGVSSGMTAWESLIILTTANPTLSKQNLILQQSINTPPPNRHQLEPWTPQCQPFYTYSVQPRQHMSSNPISLLTARGMFHLRFLRFLAFSFSSFSYYPTWEKRQKTK